MTEAEMRILEMLAQHKITAEQAGRLLEASAEGEVTELGADAQRTMTKLGQMLARGLGAGKREGSWTEAREEAGERIERAERGFEMPPESALVVTVKDGSVKVVQQKQGDRASLRSSGDGVSMRRAGRQYFLDVKGSPEEVELDIPPVKSLTVDVAGGRAVLAEVKADSTVRLKGGSFVSRGFAGNLSGKCLGGSMHVAGKVRGIDLKCMGGSVTVGELVIVQGEHRIKTMGGSVSLGVSRQASLKMRTKTLGGNVTTDIPAMRRNEGVRSSVSEYKVGAGAAVLNVKALGGNVDVHWSR